MRQVVGVVAAVVTGPWHSYEAYPQFCSSLIVFVAVVVIVVVVISLTCLSVVSWHCCVQIAVAAEGFPFELDLMQCNSIKGHKY